MQMDLFRESAKCSRLEKIRNNVIREKINIENSILDYKRYKRLNWYGYVRKMGVGRLAQKNVEWCPPGRGSRRRRRKGKPRKSWMQEVTTGMRDKDRGGGIEKKNKTLGTEGCENIVSLYLNYYYY